MSSEPDRPLQLEVFINDAPAQLIGSFVARSGTVAGSTVIGAQRAELIEIGVNPPAAGGPDGIVVLDDMPGLVYRYDVPGQRIFLSVPEALRSTKDYEVAPNVPASAEARADFGSVLNYNLFGASVGKFGPEKFGFDTMSATLDGRVFSPFGTLSQSGILRTSNFSNSEFLRLDTVFAYSDPATLTTYRAGDTITGGFAWTRPIRIGGLQAQRNFALRPDLVTLPLPSLSGSAAVPSVADVYINNVRTYSQEVAAGPYRLTNIPAITGTGEARVVLRDPSGKETQTTLPLYASPRLLAPGLYDFSLEAGTPRLGYGTSFDGYGKMPVAAGSWRQGISDWLTFEGHAEGGARLLNGGLGIVARTGSFGVVSLAAAASQLGQGSGAQSYASYETRIAGVSLQASSQMTFGQYEDLAAATARLRQEPRRAVSSIFDLLSYDLASATGSTYASLSGSAKAPKAVNRFSVGTPLPGGAGTVGASFIDLKSGAGDRSRIVTASYSRPLPFGAFVTATAFTDIAKPRSTGAFLGLSVPIGGGATASAYGASASKEGQSGNFEVVKPLGHEPGSVGWRLRGSPDLAGEQSGAAAYRSSYGWGEATVSRFGGRTTTTAQVDGAVATLGTGVFAASRIDDSFAVVDTGVPGLGVLHENRKVGVTDANGRLLVPGLRSYEQNRIAIDAGNLPLTADVTTTQDLIAPASRSGVRVDFGVQTNVEAAVLIISRADGKPVEAGSHGQVEGGQSFVVGYDGRAYVKRLARENAIVVAAPEGPCRATFSYARKDDAQVAIPTVCQ